MKFIDFFCYYTVSHSNYLPPPLQYKAMRPRTSPQPAYNHIVTDVALPYPVNKQKESEAQVCVSTQ